MRTVSLAAMSAHDFNVPKIFSTRQSPANARSDIWQISPAFELAYWCFVAWFGTATHQRERCLLFCEWNFDLSNKLYPQQIHFIHQLPCTYMQTHCAYVRICKTQKTNEPVWSGVTRRRREKRNRRHSWKSQQIKNKTNLIHSQDEIKKMWKKSSRASHRIS